MSQLSIILLIRESNQISFFSKRHDILIIFFVYLVRRTFTKPLCKFIFDCRIVENDQQDFLTLVRFYTVSVSLSPEDIKTLLSFVVLSFS